MVEPDSTTMPTKKKTKAQEKEVEEAFNFSLSLPSEMKSLPKNVCSKLHALLNPRNTALIYHKDSETVEQNSEDIRELLDAIKEAGVELSTIYQHLIRLFSQTMLAIQTVANAPPSEDEEETTTSQSSEIPAQEKVEKMPKKSKRRSMMDVECPVCKSIRTVSAADGVSGSDTCDSCLQKEREKEDDGARKICKFCESGLPVEKEDRCIKCHNKLLRKRRDEQWEREETARLVDAANSRMHDRKARPTSFASPSVLSPEPPVRKKAKTSKKPTVNRNFVMPSDSELSSRASSTILPSPVQTLENVINFVENDAAFSDTPPSDRLVIDERSQTTTPRSQRHLVFDESDENHHAVPSTSNEKPFNPFEGIEMPGLDDDPISDKPSNRNGDQRIAGNDAGVFDFNVPSTSDKAKNTRLCDRCGCPLRHNVKGFCASCCNREANNKKCHFCSSTERELVDRVCTTCLASLNGGKDDDVIVLN